MPASSAQDGRVRTPSGGEPGCDIFRIVAEVIPEALCRRAHDIRRVLEFLFILFRFRNDDGLIRMDLERWAIKRWIRDVLYWGHRSLRRLYSVRCATDGKGGDDTKGHDRDESAENKCRLSPRRYERPALCVEGSDGGGGGRRGLGIGEQRDARLGAAVTVGLLHRRGQLGEEGGWCRTQSAHGLAIFWRLWLWAGELERQETGRPRRGRIARSVRDTSHTLVDALSRVVNDLGCERLKTRLQRDMLPIVHRACHVGYVLSRPM